MAGWVDTLNRLESADEMVEWFTEVLYSSFDDYEGYENQIR
jgi:hypothetical protein